MRRAEAGKRGHEVHSIVIFDGVGDPVRLFGRCEDAQFVAEPLDGGACDEDAALERVGTTSADLPTECR